RRAPAYAIWARSLRVFVDGDLGDGYPPGHLGGELVEKRRDHLARAAPFCPEIDEHRLAGAEYHGIEAAVADRSRLHREILCLVRADIRGAANPSSRRVGARSGQLRYDVWGWL